MQIWKLFKSTCSGLVAKIRVTQLILVLLCFSLLFICQFGIGKIPPLGSLFSPVTGFWRNLPILSEKLEELKLEGKNGIIFIKRDKAGTPHILANSNTDAAFAQGYITASDRLFQMDIQARSAAGRLSELVGEVALERDIYKRKFGMTFAAEKLLEANNSNLEMKEILEEYARGVNFYISKLTPSSYPIEYKFLNAKPDLWTPLHSALFAKEMSFDLSGSTKDFLNTNSIQYLGYQEFLKLFPSLEGATEPIVSKNQEWNFKAAALKALPQLSLSGKFIDIPSLPKSLQGVPNQNINSSSKYFPLPEPKILPTAEPSPFNGSNSWAVHGSKTLNGSAILSDDPHLGLRLPSIWYQIQLKTPLKNVAGASLPGLPGIVVGFNNSIAWGVTNNGVDALDFYKITLKTKTNSSEFDESEYMFDGKWTKTQKRREIVRVKGKKDVEFDVAYTHHGPIFHHMKLSDGTFWPVAVRWAAHDTSSEIEALHKLNQSKGIVEAKESLRKYHTPAQNFTFIDNLGNISMQVVGKIPLKWPGQGLQVLDGGMKQNDWLGYVPYEENPTETNPVRGFVSSANQDPTNAKYPYYMAGYWQLTPRARGERVNEMLLQAPQKINESYFEKMLADEKELALTKLVKIALNEFRLFAISENFNDKFLTEHKDLLEKLASWNGELSRDSDVALFIDAWSHELRSVMWEKQLPKHNSQWPTFEICLKLIEHNTQKFQILRDSFLQTHEVLKKAYGADYLKLSFGKARGTTLPHIGKIPGFGVEHLETGGSQGTINAQRHNHGPSVKLIVTFENNIPSAKIILPGGPSGNPGSRYYLSDLEQWHSGKLRKVEFFQNVSDFDIEGIEFKENKKESSLMKSFGFVLQKLSWWIFPLFFSLFSWIFCLLFSGFFLAALGFYFFQNHELLLLERVSAAFGLSGTVFPVIITIAVFLVSAFAFRVLRLQIENLLGSRNFLSKLKF